MHVNRLRTSLPNWLTYLSSTLRDTEPEEDAGGLSRSRVACGSEQADLGSSPRSSPHLAKCQPAGPVVGPRPASLAARAAPAAPQARPPPARPPARSPTAAVRPHFGVRTRHPQESRPYAAVPHAADRPRRAVAERPDRAREALPRARPPGQAHRDARGHVLARGHRRRRGGPPLRRERRPGPGPGRGVLRPHDPAPVRAQLADADERGAAVRPALRLLRAPRRRRPLQRPDRDLRHAPLDGAHPPERRRHRLRLQPPAPQGRDGALDHRGRERPGQLHEALRRVDRRREAGRHAPRRDRRAAWRSCGRRWRASTAAGSRPRPRISASTAARPSRG